QQQSAHARAERSGSRADNVHEWAPRAEAFVGVRVGALALRGSRQALAIVAAVTSIAVALGNVDSTGDVGVIDVSAAFRLDAEIPADFVHFDLARAIVLHHHRAA